MKKLILWDLDGTLIDTIKDLGAAVNHTLDLRGLPSLRLDDYRHMVGHGVRNLVQKALEEALKRSGAEGTTGLEDSYVDSALADFMEYYTANIDVYSRPYPGMPELLSELASAGVRMAVVSNKFQEGTEKLVRRFFPAIDFVAILGDRPGRPLKPSPEIVEEVLRRADAGVGYTRARNEADAVLVGDSPTDVRTAANSGIDAIAVAWGYRSTEELAGNAPAAPLRIAGDVYELRRMLDFSNQP